MIRTVAQARQAVVSEPKRWRAAICIQDRAPLTDAANVTLYATKKGAQDALRAFLTASKAEGYVLRLGNLGRGYCVLQRDGETRAAALDYRGRRKI